MKRQAWIGPATLAVAVAILLWQVIPWAVGHTSQAPGPAKPTASPAVHVLHFDVNGDGIQSAGARYADSNGMHLDPTINGDIQVTGLLWATVAVYGTDVGCGITLDGITVGLPEGSVNPDGSINMCTYSRSGP